MTNFFSRLRLYLSALVTASIFIGSAQSVPPYQIMDEAEQVAEAINVATDEILIATDVIRSELVADALREALVVRGVPVYMLVPADSVEENASYAASLALAGASVRLSEVGGSFLVIDRRYTIAGSLIGSLGQSDDGLPTLYVDDETYAAQFVEGFLQGFEPATIYTPEAQ